MLEETAHDLRHGLRLLRKSPGFTAVALLTLALGIGVNSAVFSIVNGALLRPLPYKDPSRLVAVWDKGIGDANLAKIFDSYHDFEAFEKDSRSFDQIAAATWATRSQILTGRGPTRELKTIPVSASFFSMLGVSPERGRTFTPADVNRGCSVVIADRFWRETLDTAPGVLHETLALDGRDCAIVGVMPPGFSFYPDRMQVWTLITPDFFVPHDKLLVGVFGRLKPGVSREQAQAELTSIHTAVHQSDDRERNISPFVYGLQQEFTFLAGRNLRTTLWVLLAAVGLVLLIACLNISNLLLGRSFAREREMAVRAALGSGRSRLVRQLLTEGLVLGVAGGALGILVAFAAIRAFQAVSPIELPVGSDIGLSLPVLALTVALSILAALFFAMAPAWKASRVDLNDVLKSGGRGSVSGARQRLAKVLLASETALAVVLLVGAGLLMQSVLRMGDAPLGFDPDHVVATSINLPSKDYPDDKRRGQFFAGLTSRLEALPGVLTAALSTSLPPQGGGFNALEVQGREPISAATEVRDVSLRQISPAYFRTLRMPLRSGRAFDSRDRIDSEQVGIVNEGLARKYFPNGDAIGHRVRIFDPRAPNPWVTIVGVAGNEKHAIVYQEMNWIETLFLFRPIAQDPPSSISIVVRTAGGQASIGPGIDRVIAALDPGIPANATEPLEESISRLLTYPRFRAVVFSAFSVFTLLLAAIGLHGVLRQFVAQRTQEIGVRMAIGARAADVFRMVAKQGGTPVITGLIAGLAASAALTRYITSLLYGVGQNDPATFIFAALALVAAAAIAIALPARRATRVDPMVALRYE